MDEVSTEFENYSTTTGSVPMHDLPSGGLVNFFVIGYSISGVLSVVLNFVNIITVPRTTNSFGENTKLCLMSLTVVDLVTGLVCSTAGVLFSILPIPRGVRGTIVVLCAAFVWQSMLILTLASVDRYVAITRPLDYPRLLSRKRMIWALAAVMILGLINSAGAYVQSVLLGVCYPYSSDCNSHLTPSFIVYNFLPFTAVVVTTFVNVRLLSIARQHARQIVAQQNAVNAGNIALPVPIGAGMKGLKTIIVITCVFYIAWLPGIIISLLQPIPGIYIPLILRLIVQYAITSNSWWNACVYCIMNKSYRKELLKLFT